MVPLSGQDAVRILVATDNHVGYQENHAVRGDDSWKSFHEVMTIAKEQDVDMVLLGGDLFDKHMPSRKSMVNVIRSLRMNCLGDKPCELEFLSDGSELFGGTFNHVNYEDRNINVAIPVFSIHGNHDEPTGHEFYCALDILQETGLVNYFGRVPKNDNIEVKPILLQKGRTKLALFGLSNVRDERLFREFRNGNVKFFRPGQQQTDWFNLMVVHQNHAPRTTTGYLPENFLPDFIDLVVWGHEHDCWTEPRQNPDQGFHVIQPGSSIATQLMPGEAIDKHIGLLTIKGKHFQWKPIRLKSIRPFVFKEIVLAKIPEINALVKKTNNRAAITRYLIKTIEQMIQQADQEWHDSQDEKANETDEEASRPPLPLLRLRVDYTAPDGGVFDCENAQRITNQFIDKVANHENIILYHVKKSTGRRTKDLVEQPDQTVLDRLTLDSVRVEELVREFLTAQTLSILPQNQFGESVNQFVDKDDKEAMRQFVSDSMATQIQNLLKLDDVEHVELVAEVDRNRQRMEQDFSSGHRTATSNHARQPRPANWDSDLEGSWQDQSAATVPAGHSDSIDVIAESPQLATTFGRERTGAAARARGRASISHGASRGDEKPAGRRTTTKRNPFIEDDEDLDEMLLEGENNTVGTDPDEESDKSMFVAPVRRIRGKAAVPKSVLAKHAPVTIPDQPKSKPKSKPKLTSKSKSKSAGIQSTLDFSQPLQPSKQQSRATARRNRVVEVNDDDISDDDILDDDDAFEPIAPARGVGRR